MKKLIYIFVASLAFVCGIGIYYVRPLIIPISLVELRENIPSYQSRKFKVMGKLLVWQSGSSYLIELKDYENDCSKEPYCSRDLQFPEEVKAENITLIKELLEKNKTFEVTNFIRGEYLAEVEVTGQLVEAGINPFCNCMMYAIKVEKMKQISSIKFVTNEEMTPQ